MISPVFRPFQADDASELEQMMLALYREDPEGEPLTPAKIWRTLAELRQHPEKGRILMFWVEEMIVGYGLIIVYWSNEFGGNILCIDELFVKTEWRNQGIATQFFAILPVNPLFECVAGLQLEVTPSNARALRYYQRIGFQTSLNAHLVKRSAHL